MPQPNKKPQKRKSGHEKKKIRERSALEAAGSDPKQKKLFTELHYEARIADRESRGVVDKPLLDSEDVDKNKADGLGTNNNNRDEALSALSTHPKKSNGVNGENSGSSQQSSVLFPSEAYREAAAGVDARTTREPVDLQGTASVSSTNEQNAVDIEIEAKDNSADHSSAFSGNPGTEQTNKANKSEKEGCSSNSSFPRSKREPLSAYVSLIDFLPPAKDSSVDAKLAFLKNHPIQPSSEVCPYKLPFATNKLYFYTLPSGEKIKRKWLSYCSEKKQIFCTTCMVFGKSVDFRGNLSSFVTGHDVKDAKHVYSSVESHEKSKNHLNACDALLQASVNRDITSCIDVNLREMRRQEVELRRQIVKRLIDVIVFVGRQGLAYRGTSDEAAYSLEDRSVNHGNFLELVLLLKDYDVVLKEHINKCIELSKRMREKRKEKGGETSAGRGSLVTFLSKTFINKLIKAIGECLQAQIISDLKEATWFGLLVDSTQDVSVLDQMAVVVRYVLHGKVYERLLRLLAVHDSRGKAVYNLICKEFSEMKVEIVKLNGCSFDGAANMSAKYEGLQAHFKVLNPDVLFTHCVGHVLNLVMVDATECCLSSENLFGLVQETAVFFSESHKRMDVVREVKKQAESGHGKMSRLQVIGKTRWWSKDKALSSQIDLDVDEESISTSKFAILLEALFKIVSRGSTFDAKTKFLANALLKNWSKFENILTAAVYLDIFKASSVASKYLQCKSLNYLTAFNMVEKLAKEIEKKRSDEHFESLYEKSKNFAALLNEKLNLHDPDVAGVPEDFHLQEDFKPKKMKRTKKMAGEQGDDDRPKNPKDVYRIETFLNILDVAKSSLDRRFIANADLLKDCACLDPKNFNDVITNGLPENALREVGRLAKVDKDTLSKELETFAAQYSTLTKDLNETFEPSKDDVPLETDIHVDIDEESDEIKESYPTPTCKKCLKCAFDIVRDIVQQSGLFPNLYCVYQFVLTLPCTQITCERVFSKLKIVKTKLRSTISQEIFEPLFLMNVEYDMVASIDKDKIIDSVARTSTELSRLLL